MLLNRPSAGSFVLPVFIREVERFPGDSFKPHRSGDGGVAGLVAGGIAGVMGGRSDAQYPLQAAHRRYAIRVLTLHRGNRAVGRSKRCNGFWVEVVLR